MKNIKKYKKDLFKTIICIIFILILPNLAKAEQTVSLNLPMGFKACPTSIWTGERTAIWEGVKDNRPVTEVGQQTKKHQDPVGVYATPKLEVLLNNAFKEQLPLCGLKLIKGNSDNAMSLSVEIDEFYAGVEKGFISGKGQAKSTITLIAHYNNETTKTVTVTSELESKRVKRKSLRQLTDTLNTLLADTVTQALNASQTREF